MATHPSTAAVAPRPLPRLGRRASRRFRLPSSTSRASDDFPEPETPVTTVSRPSGMRAFTLRRLCRSAPWMRMDGVSASTARRRVRECLSGAARHRPVGESCMRSSSRAVPCATSCPPRVPAPGPRSMTWSARRMVSSSCSTTTSVLPLLRSRSKVSRSADVVARVQSDRGLIEHIAHALQIRAELRGEPDTLRLAAGQRGRRAIELQVPEAHVVQRMRCGP